MAQEVDIISMSWTFKKKGNEDDDEKKFVRLIQEAASTKNIILFGSVPNKGPTAEAKEYYPVSLSKVIKIGSATKYGQQSKENLYGGPEYLLPGEDLQFGPNDIASGSSLTTACASGLAALVLYCMKAHLRLNDPDPHDERTKRLNKAKTVDGMKVIFNILSQKNADSNPLAFFLRPYRLFPDKIGDSENERLIAIRHVVTQVLPAAELHSP
jgi:Subtilase family